MHLGSVLYNFSGVTKPFLRIQGTLMKIHEYQAKAIFSRYGIPIPKGRIAAEAEEAKHIAEELGGRVVVKAQVLVGGRGKAGGVRLAKTPKEAEELATHILGMEIRGMPVRKVLVDEAVSIDQEIYVGITNDRAVHRPVIIASSSGGIDLEEVARKAPEKIYRVYIDPLLGLHDYQIRNLAVSIDLPRYYWRTFLEIGRGLWNAFVETDSTLAEINPLVIAAGQRMIALDGKMIIDDNALYRHPDLVDLRDMDEELPAETEARKYGLSYIQLDGQIGCLVNGAGLAMATMDIIKLFGGEPANFLDVGGGAGSEKVAAAFRMILSDPSVKAILINIFGGITRCDVVARGILAAIADVNPAVPMVARLVGTNADVGLKLLSNAHMSTAATLADAARIAVRLAQGG